jgi:hypothetical protein
LHHYANGSIRSANAAQFEHWLTSRNAAYLSEKTPIYLSMYGSLLWTGRWNIDIPTSGFLEFMNPNVQPLLNHPKQKERIKSRPNQSQNLQLRQMLDQLLHRSNRTRAENIETLETPLVSSGQFKTTMKPRAALWPGKVKRSSMLVVSNRMDDNCDCSIFL